jgi:hypothetical protein
MASILKTSLVQHPARASSGLTRPGIPTSPDAAGARWVSGLRKIGFRSSDSVTNRTFRSLSRGRADSGCSRMCESSRCGQAPRPCLAREL